MAGSDWKELEFSSGVKVLYGPFPHGLYWDIMSQALDEYPDPDVPKKEIAVLMGTEEVDDLENPEYQAALTQARLARFSILTKAALDMCVEVEGWPEQWEPAAKKAAQYSADPPPEDPDEFKVWFLERWALRTREDWKVVGKIQRFSQIEDDEVRQRAEFFRRNMEGAEDPGVDAPGPAEE